MCRYHVHNIPFLLEEVISGSISGVILGVYRLEPLCSLLLEVVRCWDGIGWNRWKVDYWYYISSIS